MITIKSCAFSVSTLLGIFVTAVLRSAKVLSCWLASLGSWISVELWKAYKNRKPDQPKRNQNSYRGTNPRPGQWKPRNQTKQVAEAHSDFHWIWLTCQTIFKNLLIAVSISVKRLKNLFPQQQ